MSLFNRKTVLDDDIYSLSMNSISFNPFDPGDYIGAATGGLAGNDVFELDLTGADAAAEEARKAAKLSADATLAATEKNVDFQKWLWGEQKELTQPWVTAGGEALGNYQ